GAGAGDREGAGRWRTRRIGGFRACARHGRARRAACRRFASLTERAAMNWLTNFVRPKIRALVRKADVPENLWDKCPSCAKMIFHRDLEANARVCPRCGHHMRLPAKRRLAMLFDE